MSFLKAKPGWAVTESGSLRFTFDLFGKTMESQDFSQVKTLRFVDSSVKRSKNLSDLYLSDQS